MQQNEFLESRRQTAFQFTIATEDYAPIENLNRGVKKTICTSDLDVINSKFAIRAMLSNLCCQCKLAKYSCS
ncbi:hypothetical protein GJ496_006336 [Pomphorhynchus laevis]|nr:hypothetical protein GJ496_006336 [Pomphorhynchus laevis]